MTLDSTYGLRGAEGGRSVSCAWCGLSVRARILRKPNHPTEVNQSKQIGPAAQWPKSGAWGPIYVNIPEPCLGRLEAAVIGEFDGCLVGVL